MLATTRRVLLLAALAAAGRASGDEGEPAAPEPSAVRFQATVATQWHPSFPARFTGPNSLRPGAESATSIVMDVFAGARLWRGAEAWIQPELAGGRGLSSTLGVAAFPSGEVYRVGNPAPSVILARVFLRQVIGLGGGPVPVEAGPFRLGGARQRDALTLTVGKISTPDFVDSDRVSSDPHTRFMSWGLFASGAYDYPADTRGYTWGAVADLTIRWWSVRTGVFLEPRTANGMALEWDVGKARGLVAEYEARFTLAGRPAAARLLGYLNQAHMGSYAEALARGAPPDVTATRADGRVKYGFAASADADLGRGLAAFVRASANDGETETWAFTEIDRSLALGVVQSGARWGRPGDEAGIAAVVSGLSDPHRRYLSAGGLGFILGDGALDYAPEVLGEVYYRLALTRAISIGGNYQPIFNPGYDAARGPVHVLTARLHVEL